MQGRLTPNPENVSAGANLSHGKMEIEQHSRAGHLSGASSKLYVEQDHVGQARPLNEKKETWQGLLPNGQRESSHPRLQRFCGYKTYLLPPEYVRD